MQIYLQLKQRSQQMLFTVVSSLSRAILGYTAAVRRLAAAPGVSQSGTLQTILALLSLTTGAYVVATTTAMVIHGWSAVPFWDQWDELIFSPKQIFTSWLYSQHNEHRLLFPRLLFAVDTFAFSETNKFNFFCNLALPLALAGLIVHVAHRHVSSSIADTLWITGIALTVLFSAVQFENFLWGSQVQFFGVGLAAMASVSCLVLGHRSQLSLSASIGFSAIAVYTLASGIIVPFLAIPLALSAGRSKAQIAVLGIAAVALLASYLHGYVTVPYHSDPVRRFLRPDVLVYLAVELGNPVGQLLRELRAGHDMARSAGVGTLGLVFFVTAVLMHLRRGRSNDQAELVFLGVAAFTVGVALLTALGRLKFGLESALTARYATPTLLFWLSLAMLAIIEIQRRHPGLRLVAMGLSLPCLFGLAYVQSAAVKSGLQWVASRRAGITAVLADVDDPFALRRLHPLAARVLQNATKLRAQHLAIFADEWSSWLDTPLADHIRLGDPAQCRGGIDQVMPLPVSGGAQWRVSGWAWDNARRTAPERIVLADNMGRVVGYALTGYPPKPEHAKHSGWRGHFTADKTASITAYALIDRDRAACSLAHGEVRDFAGGAK